LLAGLAAGASCISAAAELTEKDYFSELPEVLTVTRLAQPLSETPGAVTIIDRETIRRSGARDVADLLRLVPGFIVFGWNGANPVGVYHSALDDFGLRNQVLIDGRSVYSSFYLGDTHNGTMGVILDDIERIEVLRGSNSAAYGANAFLGVINIITRHAADAVGSTLSMASGDEAVKDVMLRHGWGSGNAHFRLSAAQQSDSGYRNARDSRVLSQLHFRGDLKPAADTDVRLSIGLTRKTAGEGFANSAGNPARSVTWENIYLDGAWQKSLSAQDAIKVSASFEEEATHDQSLYTAAPFAGVLLDFGGRGRRYGIELQHSAGLSADLRSVWGVAIRREEAMSRALYATDKVSTDRYQLFGNLEWHPHARWVINAGGQWEKHSLAGSEFSPRLAVNYRLATGHTLRAGLTRAFRSPSLFELKADVRYYLSGVQVARTYAASGRANAESVETRELGYLGEMPKLRLTLDVRAFEERLKDIIRPFRNPPSAPNDYINNQGFRIRGIEYQARWKPLADTEIWLNQSFLTTTHTDRIQNDLATPRHIATLAWFQRLTGGAELTVQLHGLDSMSHRNEVSDRTDPLERIDLRLAWPFRIGSTRAEVAVMSQAANGGYPIYLPSEKFEFHRRTYGTLRLEF
jgi:iron complex outermembrane receptor protein